MSGLMQMGEQNEPVVALGLRVVRDLLAKLHEANLAYCHWKSNEHLGAAVDGLTDLDILVERRRCSDLQSMLAKSGFRRFTAPSLRAYPGIADYLAHDAHSGRIVHLHLHFQLTLGERHLKSYRLPWEDQVLATRRFDRAHGVYIADPAVELVLLLVRAALKLRARDRLRSSFKSSSSAEDDFGREFEWLRQQTDSAAVRESARSLLGDGADHSLVRLLARPHDLMPLAEFAANIRPLLRRYRSFGSVEATLRAWLREAQWAADVVNRRYLHHATPMRRISPRGGTVVVLLGSDGSGKSTLAKTLTTWLGVKLDVVPIYFGSGDGPSAIYRLPMRLAYRLVRPHLQIPRPTGSSQPIANSPSRRGMLRSRLREVARVPWALALSCEKRGKLKRMTRARNQGMIVVCDRFPQAQFMGFNDGPLLARWRDHQSSLCRAIAAWEAKPYAEAVLQPPDLVLKLTVTPEVAQARRPEMDLDELRRRIFTVQRLRYPPTARVVEVDADASLENVALAVKEAVWELL